MTTELWIVSGAVAVLMVLTFLVLYRSMCVENDIRRKHIEGLRKADEFRKQHAEYRRSVAEEAARLDAAGILTPHVKARMVAQGIYG